jgi:hypothetical protein
VTDSRSRKQRHQAASRQRDGRMEALMSTSRRRRPKNGSGSHLVMVSPGSRSLADICRIGLVRMTASLERVLRVFLDDPAARRYGYHLMKAAAVPSGT